MRPPTQRDRMINYTDAERDRAFDVQPLPLATLADLDRVRFEHDYLPAAFAPDVLQANDRTIEQRLAVTKMIDAADSAVPTVLGILVLGKGTREFLAGAYIQFLRIAGKDLGDPGGGRARGGGANFGVAAADRRQAGVAQPHLREHHGGHPGGAPLALPHRGPPAARPQRGDAPIVRGDQRAGAGLLVRRPDRDRQSGGPFGIVSVENFGEPGVADYRNPNLAEAMRVLGFVQRSGFGLAIARRALEENGNPPLELKVQPSHVTAIVRAAPVGSTS